MLAEYDAEHSLRDGAQVCFIFLVRPASLHCPGVGHLDTLPSSQVICDLGCATEEAGRLNKHRMQIDFELNQGTAHCGTNSGDAMPHQGQIILN